MKNEKKKCRTMPNARPFPIKPSFCDMSLFYQDLSRWITENCPAVIIVDQLPDEKPAFWVKQGDCIAVLISHDVPDYRKLEIVMAGPPSSGPHLTIKTNILPTKYCPDFSDIYGFTSIVANSLAIPCPQLFLSENIEDRGTLLNDGNCPRVIMIKSSVSLFHKFQTIAHEMRHAWQHHTDPEHYFVHYQYSRENGLDEYMQQKAELDADAFSYAFCSHVLDYPLKCTRFSNYTNQLINKLAEKMAASPAEYGYKKYDLLKLPDNLCTIISFGADIR